MVLVEEIPLDQEPHIMIAKNLWQNHYYDLTLRAMDEIALLDALTTDVDISDN